MAHPFDRFERVYIINLASRRDRRAEMTEQLASIGIDAASPRIVWFDAVRPSDAGGFPSIGARGCYLSHLGVLRDAIGAGLQRILVLEDDVDFAADFKARAPIVVGELERTGCSIFYGGYRSDELPSDSVRNGLVEIAPHFPVMTTHFMGFDGPAMEVAAEHLSRTMARPPGDPAGGPMHVDGAYSRLRRERPELRTAISVPALGHQRASRTDIHDLRWFDAVPGVRSVVARIRRARNA